MKKKFKLQSKVKVFFYFGVTWVNVDFLIYDTKLKFLSKSIQSLAIFFHEQRTYVIRFEQMRMRYALPSLLSAASPQCPDQPHGSDGTSAHQGPAL